MKLATLRRGSDTAAVRVDAESAVSIEGVSDVGTLLQDDAWRDRASNAGGEKWALTDIAPHDWAPVIPRPRKIVCVGLNYRSHILEMGRPIPEYPTIFAKFSEALIGPNDDIELPHVSDEIDWEGELAVIVGQRVRRTSESDAAHAVAGYAVLNDITARDYQYRTLQWLQGKTFENTTPFGPYLVTPDEWSPGPALRTHVDGELMQEISTDGLVFTPTELIAYISEIITLNPGDVIATGTPGGVGHARNPRRYLSPGSVVTCSIDGLGIQTNRAVSAQ